MIHFTSLYLSNAISLVIGCLLDYFLSRLPGAILYCSTPELKRCCSYIFAPSQLFPLHCNNLNCVAYYLFNAISLVIGRLLYYFLSLTVMIHVALFITSQTLVTLSLQRYFPCNQLPSILFSIAFAGRYSIFSHS